MLLLNQSHLAFASGGFLEVITLQTSVWISIDFTNGMDLSYALGTNANPFDLTLLWNTAELLVFQCFVIAHGSISSSAAMAFCLEASWQFSGVLLPDL